MHGIIRRYRARLPVSDTTPIVTLLEGDTPLVPAPRLAKAAGLPEDSVHLKLEGANPTGSFKDRGMTLAMSKALEEGSKGVLCASTGNTAASAAAYAARAGLPCVVVLPAGKVASGKLAQALMHGASVLAVKGGFDEALRISLEAAREEGWTVVNSTNPYRLQGQKTAAFEISEALGRMPDYQFMPVGNAGNITAYWMGYCELQGPRPAMMGFQAAGAAPIVLGKPVTSPKTVATAIRIGNPFSWKKAVEAKDESGGLIDKVTDREILSAYRFLAEKEGVFCEPSSAAGAAGLLKHGRSLRPGRDLRVVCILTGHGLKDPEAPALLKHRVRRIPADAAAIRRVLRCGR
ncbi:MAG: threonine synthase [Elusimicrobiota bacterium]